MTLRQLFFSFSGRIGRMQWWLALIVIVVSLFAGAFLIGVLSALIGEAQNGQVGAVGSVLLIGLVIAFYVSLAAIGVKRLHDREKSGWWIAVYLGINVLSALAVQGQMTGTMQGPTVIGIIAGVVNLVVFVWFVIWLGFLKGTQGPNQYGPDPLGATQLDASF